MTANAGSVPEPKLHDEPDPDIEAAAPASRQCRQWLIWAAAQIEDCQQMDSAAMNTLVTVLQPILHAPPDAQSAPRHHAAAAPAADLVIAIQSHDRIMQALTHVADSLRALEEHIENPARADSPAAWRALREQRFAAFSMPSERELFASLLGHHESAAYHESAAHPTRDFGCVDLFEDEP